MAATLEQMRGHDRMVRAAIDSAPPTTQPGARELRQMINEQRYSQDDILQAAAEFGPPQVRSVTEQLEHAFTMPNPTTGALERPAGSAVEGRFNTISTAEQAIRTFLTSGFDALPAADQAAIVAQVTAAIEKQPVVHNFFATGAGGAANVEAMVRRMMNSGGLRLKIRGAYKNLFEEPEHENRLPDFNLNTIAAKESADSTYALHKEHLDSLQAEFNAVRAQLHEFRNNPGNPTAVPPVAPDIGPRAAEITALEAQLLTEQPKLPNYEADYTFYRNELQTLEHRLSTERAKAAPNPAIVAHLQTEAATRRAQKNHTYARVRGIQNKIARLNALVTKRTELEAQKETVRGSVEAAITQLHDANVAKIEADAALSSQIYDREHKQQQLIDKATGMFGAMASQYVKDNLGYAKTFQETRVTALTTEENNKAQRALGEGLLSRYFRQGGWRRRRQIRHDYRLLLRQGKEAYLRDVLRDAGIDNEIIDANVTNPDYGSEALRTLMGARLELGKISKRDAKRLARSTWGEHLLMQGLEKNNEMKAHFEEMRQSGRLRGTLSDAKKEWIKKHGWKFVLGAAGVAAAAYLGPTALGVGGFFQPIHIAVDTSLPHLVAPVTLSVAS